MSEDSRSGADSNSTGGARGGADAEAGRSHFTSEEEERLSSDSARASGASGAGTSTAGDRGSANSYYGNTSTSRWQGLSQLSSRALASAAAGSGTSASLGTSTSSNPVPRQSAERDDYFMQWIREHSEGGAGVTGASGAAAGCSEEFNLFDAYIKWDFLDQKTQKKCTFWLILDQKQRFLAKNIPFDVRIEKIEQKNRAHLTPKKVTALKVTRFFFFIKRFTIGLILGHF